MLNNLTLLLVRIVLAVVMIKNGWPKMRNPIESIKEFDERGFWPPIFWSAVVTAVEFFGGFAVLIGAENLAHIGAGLFGMIMITGVFVKAVKERKPFDVYSYDLILLALVLVILAFGTGSYTLF